MKDWIFSPRFFLFALLLPFILVLPGCTGEELEVAPYQTCDTQATVRSQKDCGLVLQLENGQLLMPLHVTTLPLAGYDKQQYKINNFTVSENQQVIIGFVKKGEASNNCYNGIPLVEVTCIVGYQIQS
ncbi:hypothetical protein [Adhaeribacter pallidiroseus]|uniref:Lipoprotein n=1 Tax=Adhaeribacter pallidiroseus TaxID=2072847 RepID=A0A369QFB2_9BACT|nr:hypothetical protein [Adhaeribacter pallidiroseus]RDC61579.1 hypothetical protein AHMF7616_00158 [Adhaeribacter pallidiroseus]